jgi:hypothetical protein
MAVSSPELNSSSAPSSNGGPPDAVLTAKLSLRLVVIFALLAIILFSSAGTFQPNFFSAESWPFRAGRSAYAAGVFWFAMYCLTISSGAPPQEAAK